MKKFSLIVAATSSSLGIGRNGKLPWNIPSDLRFFKQITSVTESEQQVNAVIMGRKTWESIPKNFRPLPKRLNVILTSNSNLREELQIPDSVLISNSLESALETLSTEQYSSTLNNIFVIGGSLVYHEAIRSKRCHSIFFTEILTHFESLDSFFPSIPAHVFSLKKRSATLTENDISFRFCEFERLPEDAEFLPPVPVPTTPLPSSFLVNPEEDAYLSLVRRVIETGARKGDRTGTGTLSLFGERLRFSCREGCLPLLTTKRVFFRGVAEELLWFIRGSTNSRLLAEKGVHIWDGNGSKEFLESRGLGHREEGDLGPVYGFQWRHFGAKYVDMHSDYSEQGVDQLRDLIHKIRTNPEDRRLLMTAWNPSDLALMALPPCHLLVQFYVAQGELHCQMYQRSADLGLGVPFNIASYALLLHFLALVTDLRPGDLTLVLGDSHVYLNHVDPLQQQLLREPRAFPKLHIREGAGKREDGSWDIELFQFEDLQLQGYEPHPPLPMAMAV